LYLIFNTSFITKYHLFLNHRVLLLQQAPQLLAATAEIHHAGDRTPVGASSSTLRCHLQGPRSGATAGFPLVCDTEVGSADVRSPASKPADRAPFRRAPCLLMDRAASAAAPSTEAGQWPETKHPASAEGQGKQMQLPGEVREKHSFLQAWAAAVSVHFQLPPKKRWETWLSIFNFLSLS